MSLASKVRYVLRNSLVPIIGWERWNRVQHRALHGYWPDFRQPETLLEYLQHSKYYGFAREIGPMIDKYIVKQYVRECIGEKHVIPTLAIIRPNEEVPYSVLPDRWIAKSVHAAGWNHLHAGGELDRKAFERKVRRWLSRNYFDHTGEVNYRYVPPKVVFEPLISNPGEDLADYKIWCFDGRARLIGVHGDRQRRAKGQIFDLEFSPMPWKYPEIPDWSGASVPKPKNLAQLVAVAEKLANPFPFVRVDLYEVDGRIYFGELTFTPGDGNNIRIPWQDDRLYGSLIVNHSRPRAFRIGLDVPTGDLLQR